MTRLKRNYKNSKKYYAANNTQYKTPSDDEIEYVEMPSTEEPKKVYDNPILNRFINNSTNFFTKRELVNMIKQYQQAYCNYRMATYNLKSDGKKKYYPEPITKTKLVETIETMFEEKPDIKDILIGLIDEITPINKTYIDFELDAKPDEDLMDFINTRHEDEKEKRSFEIELFFKCSDVKKDNNDGHQIYKLAKEHLIKNKYKVSESDDYFDLHFDIIIQECITDKQLHTMLTKFSEKVNQSTTKDGRINTIRIIKNYLDY